MSVDLQNSYKEAQDKIAATKTYNEVRSGLDSAKQVAGDTFEQSKDEITGFKNQVQDQTKSFQRDLPNQLDQLLNLAIMSTGGHGENTLTYLKNVLIKTLIDIGPKIRVIMEEEVLRAVGCSQQQTYAPITIYIPVSSVDLSGMLFISPTDDVGKIRYEKESINVGSIPFAMNKELYNRVQNNGTSFNSEYAINYKGTSGQDLFNLQYTTTDQNGVSGQFFKVDLTRRQTPQNFVFEFIQDYYSTIKIVDLNNIITCLLQSMTGAISMSVEPGNDQINDESRFLLIIQRILGLCFDNDSEINVSGNKKIAELDGVDPSFFQFTEIDQRKIDKRLKNIKSKVVEFAECNNVLLPLNYDSIIDNINQLNLVDGDVEKTVKVIDGITNSIASNPLFFPFKLNASLDVDFIKKLTHGLILSLLSPKLLLPIIIMQKAIGKFANEELPTSLTEFAKKFSQFFIAVTSRVFSIFIKEIFDFVSKDIKNLLQAVIKDIAKEKADVRIIVILKLVQLLIVVAQFVRDYRKCKSVIDEILWLFKIATSGFGDRIPLPLLFASQLLSGMSTASAFLGALQEMQKAGVPTGTMPSGAPNLELGAKLATIKGMMDEIKVNGRVDVAIPPLQVVTPLGPLPTIPNVASGKLS